MHVTHREHHHVLRIGWLRAAVLGANDGIISTASLIIGVAAANSSPSAVLIAGVAALVAGAMSMAAGEYVSVSSQADSEKAELAIEQHELETNRPGELKELTNIYIKRGVEPKLAEKVAEQLMEFDALGAHARDEMGITEEMSARPLQAAFSSAASFSLGAAIPLSVIALLPPENTIVTVSITALITLSVLGVISAKIGKASMKMGAIRVTFWGTLAMAASAGIGHLFGTVV